MKEERAIEISEHIDRLITVDIHTRQFIIDLYNAARKKMGDKPLTYLAAKAVLSSFKEGSCIIFLAGFPTFGTYIAEQDGPVGAAVLSRVLAELLSAKIVAYTDAAQAEMVKRTFMGVGFSMIDSIKDFVHNHQALVKGVKENTSLDAGSILDECNASMVITIERPSKNINGKYMSMKGLDLSYKIARLDEIVEEAKRRHITTIGIADGGNEIGCGLIREDV
ncbi:MAG: glutamate cyclase domain-containing protein, partial [Fervidicoccus sp.]